MSNQKQDGSNCINIEYTTGRCQTRCEQCFVNFGQQGQATCKSIVNPEHQELLKFLEEEAKTFGRYTLPPKLPRGTKAPKGHELLLRQLTADGKGMTNIPTMGAWDAWVVEKTNAEKKKYQTVKGLERFGLYPYFLRVSSMSDSSWAPFEWLRDVHRAWGDHCFFNSAIRSLKRAVGIYGVGLMDHYHKLVVTVNPGAQALREIQPQISRFIDSEKRDRSATRWARENKVQLSAAGSMGNPGNRPRDFFHPQTLGDIDLGGYEDIIKFYRLRALPTVQPRFETDSPVVVTQMRFKGLDHILEFCRRYRLNVEVHTPVTKTGRIPKSVADPVEIFKSKFGLVIPVVPDARLQAKQVYVWTDKRHAFNESPHAGEASVFMWEGSFYLNIHPEAFDHMDYVCDRRHGSCKACGLCASLDGTQRENTNWLNVSPEGELLRPIPGPQGAFYLGDVSQMASNYFAEIQGEAVALSGFAELAGLEDFGGFYRNPQPPIEPDVAAGLLHAVSRYVDKELTIDSDFCESWNTHEESATTTAWAIWSLMVHAKAEGMSKAQAFDWISKIVADAAGPYDILDGIGDVWGMWDDDSDWTDQFGSTEL